LKAELPRSWSQQLASRAQRVRPTCFEVKATVFEVKASRFLVEADRFEGKRDSPKRSGEKKFLPTRSGFGFI
jgi:hypothetical protein